MEKVREYTHWTIGMMIAFLVEVFFLLWALQNLYMVGVYIGLALIIPISFLALIIFTRFRKEHLRVLKAYEYMKEQNQKRVDDERRETERKLAREQEMQSTETRIAQLNEKYQAYTDIDSFTRDLLQEFAHETESVMGLFYVRSTSDDCFHAVAEYAYYSDTRPISFPEGETLTGQIARDHVLMNLKEVPEGYMSALSGLGMASPKSLLMVPIVFEGQSIGVLELAAFESYPEHEEKLIDGVCKGIAAKLNELRQ